MRVLVTGSSGLVGRHLVPHLESKGHRVACLLRGDPTDSDPLRWSPTEGRLDSGALEGFDTVIHLAGENIGDKRWSDEQKQRILNSRTLGTELLARTLASMTQPPQTFIGASAVGYYGDRDDDLLTEDAVPGEGFLAKVCRQWEKRTLSAREVTRVVSVRFGVILSTKGGALKKMLLPFRLGLGGRMGTGRQYMSWLTINDAVAILEHCAAQESIVGPINAATPNPVTNLQFTRTLGRVLFRPTIFPMPAFAARIAFGEMADELLLASTRVTPRKLLDTGYTFRHGELGPALQHLLEQ